MFELKSSLCICCCRIKCRQPIGYWAQVQSSHWSCLQPITSRLPPLEGRREEQQRPAWLDGASFAFGFLAGCLNAVRPPHRRLLASFPPAKHPRPPRSCPAATMTYTMQTSMEASEAVGQCFFCSFWIWFLFKMMDAYGERGLWRRCKRLKAEWIRVGVPHLHWPLRVFKFIFLSVRKGTQCHTTKFQCQELPNTNGKHTAVSYVVIST